MALGDMTVLGMVEDAHTIEDIGVRVPKGVEVTIPQRMVLLSKDLSRAIAQRFVVRVHETTPASQVGVSKGERSKFEFETQRLRAQVEALTGRNTLLEAQVETLQKDLSELRTRKLDTRLPSQDKPDSDVSVSSSSVSGKQRKK